MKAAVSIANSEFFSSSSSINGSSDSPAIRNTNNLGSAYKCINDHLKLRLKTEPDTVKEPPLMAPSAKNSNIEIKPGIIIPDLQDNFTVDKLNKHFTLKNLDKRINTLKSLPVKKNRGTIKNKSNEDENIIED